MLPMVLLSAGTLEARAGPEPADHRLAYIPLCTLTTGATTGPSGAAEKSKALPRLAFHRGVATTAGMRQSVGAMGPTAYEDRRRW